MRKLDYNDITEKLISWIKDYAQSANAKGFVIGISGGIDSAVTAGLCVRAVGKENVIGIGLPCESISQDLEDGKLVADSLGIKFYITDLTSTYKELLKVLPSEIKANKLSMANIKPRLRMTTLYYLGQSMGCLVGGTGNRPEIAIGYFTKYGDGGVDIEPIGDLYKCEVRAVAKVLGIPDKIIDRAPSAGLWEGQTDEGELGISYDEIDEILYRIDNFHELSDLNQDNVQKVVKMMKNAEHKLSMPPSCKINKNN